MRAARVLAQAKVNLLLHVLAREASGYHSIETLFQRIELGDDVTVRVDVPERSLDCGGPTMPAAGLGPVERNLAYRAALAYAEAVGWPEGFAIEIDKRIPVGGGLGGGSADAAAVLRVLEAMSPRPLGARLLEIAATLGADVPFLVSDASLALGWGRGERMLALAPLPTRIVTLVVPAFGVGTADAYGWLAAARDTYRPRGRSIEAGALRSWEWIERNATNDFEPVVGARHPEIAACVRWLRELGASLAMMSGSGSTVFGLFEQGAERGAATRPHGAMELIATRTASSAAPVELVR